MWPFDGLWPKTTLDWLLASHALNRVGKALEEEGERQRQLSDLDRELAETARRVVNVDTSEIEKVAEIFEGLWVEDPLDEEDFDEADDANAYAGFEAGDDADAYAGFEAGDDVDAYAGFDDDSDVYDAFVPVGDADAYSGFDAEEGAGAYACFEGDGDIPVSLAVGADRASRCGERDLDPAGSAQSATTECDAGNGSEEAPSRQEEEMRFSGGIYTFGVSVKPGVYVVSRASGEGGFGFSRARLEENCVDDIGCYPLSFFQGKRYETYGDVFSFPECVHIEAIKGSSMVITGSLVVDIRRSEGMKEPE